MAELDELKERLRRAESEISRLSEERLRAEAVLASIGDGVSIQDADFNIIYQNQVMKDLVGDRRGLRCYEAYQNEASPCAGCPVTAALGNGGIHKSERRVKTSRGEIFVDITASPVRDANGNIIAGIEIVRDITRQKHDERFIKNILESIDEAFVIIGRDYRIIAVNKALCRQVKMDEQDIIGRHCYEVTHRVNVPCFEAGETCTVKLAFETGEPSEAVHLHQDSEGNAIHVETKAYPLRDSAGNIVSAIEIINNVTEKMKLETQLRQSQKFEAIGAFAGGIAHDFNNILTAIVGFGEFLKDGMGPADPNMNYVNLILSSAERASRLTQDLLVFSRKKPLALAPVNVNRVIGNLENIISRVIGEDIDVRISKSGDDLTVMANAGHIEQVLLNLATNARDAMPRGGVLSIRTKRAHLEGGYMKAMGLGGSGWFAVISVTDTGEGMDEKTRERIFEPFFTTKEAGKGTGLGLSIVYGIVKQHSGQINVYSEMGKGTTFNVYLPLIESAAALEAEEEGKEAEGGTETVLVAEDNDIVRQVMTSVLEKAGYTVIGADNGEDAVDKFNLNKDRIGLLLFDVVMPKMGGREALAEIRRTRPDVKALFTSGYMEDAVFKNGSHGEGVDFISKPIIPKELLRKIRKILG